MKVLIVEDDQILLDMYKDQFEKEGFEVAVALNGKEAIIEASKQRVDFIILDIMMPEMDGVTAYRHLREFPKTKDIPVGFLTVVPEGVPETLHKEPNILEGAVAYWRKDEYTPIDIVKEVKKYLKV